MTSPNTRGYGGILAGLGELFQGIGNVRDPDAQQRDRLIQLLQSNPQIRDQYIQQYQNNPDGLAALLGKGPIFGKSNYDEAKALVTGPLTPAAQAAQAKAKADIVESANREQIARTLQPILTQGSKVDAFVNRGEGGQTIAAPNVPGDKEAGIEDIPVIKGPGMSEDEYQTYREALTGKVLTPQERAAQGAATSREQMLAEATRKRLPLEDLKNQKETEAIQQASKDKQVATQAMARLGGKNLYEAKLKGQLSNSELQGIMGYEKGYAQYKDDQDAYFKQKNIDIEQQNADRLRDQSSKLKDENAALWYFEKAGTFGAPISMDEARSIVQSPRDILDSRDPANQPKKDALLAIRNSNLKETRNKVSATISKWTTSLKGKLPTDEDINNLNNEISPQFAGTLFEPIVFKRDETYDPRSLSHPFTGKQHVNVIPVSGDPEIMKVLPNGMNKIPQTKTTNPNSLTQTQLSPADRYESLKKKYPKESVDQLKARVLKGES